MTAGAAAVGRARGSLILGTFGSLRLARAVSIWANFSHAEAQANARSRYCPLERARWQRRTSFLLIWQVMQHAACDGCRNMYIEARGPQALPEVRRAASPEP
jgi:hypothetical protein